MRMSEVYSYCVDGGKDGLDQQQRQYPGIRTLSRTELTNCLRDSIISRKLFPGNVIMTGVDTMVPSVENCTEDYLFEGDRFHAVPDASITALASCDITPSYSSLFMRISLHGSLTPELALGFILHFLPYYLKYNVKNYYLTIIVAILGDLDINLTKPKLQCIPFYNENIVRSEQLGIVRENRVFKSNI